ncbi:MAG: hypothetical protein ACR2GD_02595 [Pyrinomonadaceae bacterium]
MSFSNVISAKTLINFLLILGAGDKAVSFGAYDIAKSLTIPGWIVVVTLSLALIFGAAYLTRKFFGKSKLK